MNATVLRRFLKVEDEAEEHSPQMHQDSYTRLGSWWEAVLAQVEHLIALINERVYSLYRHEPLEEELQPNWLSLLEPLLRAGPLEVFTTNYDLVLETAAELLGEMPGLPRLDTCRVGKVSHYLDEQAWARPPRGWDWPDAGGKLTKLHGSLDWTRGPDRIYVGNPTFTRAHSDQVILYPGFKGRPSVEPFISFHNYFRECIQAADAVAFIGFSFRDEYINDLIERWLAPRARAVLIDPNKELKPRFERLEHIPEEFTFEVAASLADSLLPRATTKP